MATRSFTTPTVKRLFALSGNQCAFPGCDISISSPDGSNGGEICHIEAARPNGQRYNPKQTEKQRRSANNLIILCHEHHSVTDDVERYPVERMKRMKRSHEDKFKNSPYVVKDTEIKALIVQTEQYWHEIATLNRHEHIMLDLAIPINVSILFCELMEETKKLVGHMHQYGRWCHESDQELPEEVKKFIHDLGYPTDKIAAIPYYKNPFVNRNWEIHNLLANNVETRLGGCLMQLEIRFLEEKLKSGVDIKSAARLDKLRKEFKYFAQHAAFVD